MKKDKTATTMTSTAAATATSDRRSQGTWLSVPASFLSSAVAILCPACIPAIGAFLASLGLGFAVSTAFLQPALIALLLANLAALASSAARHRHWWVMAPGLAGGAAIYAGRYLWFSSPLMWAGAAILIGTTLVNLRLKRACSQCRTT